MFRRQCGVTLKGVVPVPPVVVQTGIPMVLVQREDVSSAAAEEAAKLEKKIQALNAEVSRYKDIFDSALLLVGNELIKPLTSIKGYTGLLEGYFETLEGLSDKNASYFRKIEKSISDLEEIIDTYVQMLRFNREEEIVGETLKIYFRDFVDEVIRRHCADPKRFVNTVDEDFPVISVQRKRLEVVLANILSNAEKYGGEKPAMISAAVYEELEERRCFIKVGVADYGSGIPDKIKEKVFLPFFRGRAESGEGLGLGLAIAKNMASIMGGRIEIQSETGRGTVVSMIIPVDIDENQATGTGSDG